MPQLEYPSFPTDPSFCDCLALLANSWMAVVAYPCRKDGFELRHLISGEGMRVVGRVERLKRAFQHIVGQRSARGDARVAMPRIDLAAFAGGTVYIAGALLDLGRPACVRQIGGFGPGNFLRQVSIGLVRGVVVEPMIHPLKQVPLSLREDR